MSQKQQNCDAKIPIYSDKAPFLFIIFRYYGGRKEQPFVLEKAAL